MNTFDQSVFSTRSGGDSHLLGSGEDMISPVMAHVSRGAILLVDTLDESVVGATAGACDFLGCEVSEIFGKKFGDLHIGHPTAQRDADVVGASQRGDCAQLQFHRRGQSPISLEAHFQLMQTPESCLKIVELRLPSSHDSASHESEEKMLQRIVEKQALETVSRHQGLSNLDDNFISKASHQLRTPLGVILSSAGLLGNYEKALSPMERRDCLDSIAQSVQRMTSFLEDIVCYAKIRTGVMPFNPQPGNLRNLYHGLIEEARAAAAKPISILLTPEAFPTEAKFDEALVRITLSRLLANAIKFSPSGHPIHCALKWDGSDCLITIKDHGIGIPLADSELLFQPFHRGSNVTTVPGDGLGMAIVKESVRLQKGTIAFESDAELGTTFYVRLPVFEQRDV